jgi:hypothetical protein
VISHEAGQVDFEVRAGRNERLEDLVRHGLSDRAALDGSVALDVDPERDVLW